MPATPTFSTPQELLELPKLCIQNLTKNLGGNPTPVLDHVRWQQIQVHLRPSCSILGEKDCGSFVVRCKMIAPVVVYSGTQLDQEEPQTEPCESKASKLLDNGMLTVKDLVMVFKLAHPPGQLTPTWKLRGVHAGDFIWESVNAAGSPVPGYRIKGTMAGVNSTGIYRNPALPRNGIDGRLCADSCNAPFLHGRLYGSITTQTAKFNILQRGLVDAVYRISYDPGPGNIDSVTGANVPFLTTSGRGVLHGALFLRCQ